MGDVAKAGIDQIIDLVDEVSGKALDSVVKAEDVLVATGHSAINVGDQTLDVALEEIEELRGRLVTLLRSVGDAVTAPLP